MSLKIQPPRSMPVETARLGAQLLSADSPYKLIGDQLFEQYADADFADLYATAGKPAISPVLLAFVTVFQFLEKLSDRQAAEAMRVRLDWKYALRLPLEYAGFDFSVLSEFRDRVLVHQAEARLFDQVLAQLQALGLIKPRGRQRTDSLAVLTKVRDLTRLELVVETLRLAVRAVLAADPVWSRAILPPSWEVRYGERCVAAKLKESEREVLSQVVGPDGQWLLERLQSPSTPVELPTLPAVQVLRAVWEQQFEVVSGQVVFQGAGPYGGFTRIQTPHDPEARYSKKGTQAWIGYKVQLTETDDDDLPHLITDIATTNSVETDFTALAPLQVRLAERQVLPSEQMVDGGYVSETNLAESDQRGIDLVGPAPEDTTPQARMPAGLSVTHFQIDVQAGMAICPGGHRQPAIDRCGGRVRFRFPDALCAACQLRPRCCLGRSGRTLSVGQHYPLLRAARERQQTDEFKTYYRKHRSGVEGTLSALVRGNQLRLGRYLGQAKRHLQALFTGAAVNLRRSARWLAGHRPQVRRSGLGLAPAN